MTDILLTDDSPDVARIRELMTKLNVRMIEGELLKSVNDGPRVVPIIQHDKLYDVREAAQARGPAAFNAPGRSRHKKGKR
jgi:hypothetical protein